MHYASSYANSPLGQSFTSLPPQLLQVQFPEMKCCSLFRRSHFPALPSLSTVRQHSLQFLHWLLHARHSPSSLKCSFQNAINDMKRRLKVPADITPSPASPVDRTTIHSDSKRRFHCHFILLSLECLWTVRLGRRAHCILLPGL
jgi:hypothetical protein